MTSRDWFCLALRVLGVWQLTTVVPYLAMVVSQLFDSGPLGVSEYLGGFIWVGVTTAVGLFLLLFAPAIAGRLYPTANPTDGQLPSDLPDRLLEVGLRILGAYLLVLAVHTLTTYVVNSLMTAIYLRVSWREQLATIGPRELISTVVYVTLGMIIVIGPKRIIAALDRLRYNAERDAYALPPIPGNKTDKEQG